MATSQMEGIGQTAMASQAPATKAARLGPFDDVQGKERRYTGGRKPKTTGRSACSKRFSLAW